MKCPICAAQCGDGAAECPACGLIFAKWRERALKALEPPTSTPAPPRNPWIGRSIAAGVVAFWLIGLVIYYLRR